MSTPNDDKQKQNQIDVQESTAFHVTGPDENPISDSSDSNDDK